MTELKKRKKIRLPNCDYSANGSYFITICSGNRKNIFGRIANGQTILSDAGNMIAFWWSQIPAHFSRVELDTYVIMPNHIHAIIHIVGADRCVRPMPDRCVRPIPTDDATNNDVPDDRGTRVLVDDGPDDGGTRCGRTRRSAPTVPAIMQWFKTMTTNAYIQNVKTNNWPAFEKHVWQRSFYDRIIHSERALNAIRKYIMDNPVNWQKDIDGLLNI